MFLKTDGLVVRQVNYKDNDQILTVLTKEHGLMTLKARGVRSRKAPAYSRRGRPRAAQTPP